MPAWVKQVLDQWLQAADINSGKLFRRVHKMGKVWGERLTEKAVWHVVREYAPKSNIDKLAPHDLRRTCARLCHAAGGELEQIQFLLGHVSIQTTERYLGCKQRIQGAVNDKIGIEPPNCRAKIRLTDHPPRTPEWRPIEPRNGCDDFGKKRLQWILTENVVKL